MFIDSKNEILNNQNNSSKTLSKINPNDSNEDKNQISISESNDIFNCPSPKKMLSEMTQLSKRIRKEEYENEFSNRARVEELRNKYIPAFKSFINNSIYKRTSNRVSPNKKENNIRLLINKNRLNPNIKIDKNILKPNIILKSINNAEKIEEDINDNKKITVFDFSSKINFFNELLKENFDNLNFDKHINKEDLLKMKNDKDKIILILDKNKELMNELGKIVDKYKKLRNEYIELFRNFNTINMNNNTFNKLNQEYENYITKDNINMNKKLESYENIFLSMTNYINDISKIFNLKQINYIEMKQNIINSSPKSDIAKTNVVDILNENIKLISNIMKERFMYKINFKSKLFSKKYK